MIHKMFINGPKTWRLNILRLAIYKWLRLLWLFIPLVRPTANGMLDRTAHVYYRYYRVRRLFV